MSLTDIAEMKMGRTLKVAKRHSPNKKESDKSDEYIRSKSVIEELNYQMKGDPSYQIPRA